MFAEVEGVLWRASLEQQASEGFASNPANCGARLVVPRSLVGALLLQVHGLPLTAHLSAKRTVQLLQQRFYWKHLRRDVQAYVRACMPCQARKRARPLRAGMAKSWVQNRPFQRVFIDITGPLELSARGNRFVLAMMCGFTKWPLLVALSDKSGETVARAVFEHLVCVHGLPSECLCSDRAPEFISGALQEMCRRWGLPQVTTTGYQPQAMGQVERFFRFVKTSLTISVQEFEEDWEDSLAALAFSYRVSANRITGYSPFSLVYGRDPVLPLDLALGFAPALFDSEHAYSTRLRSAISAVYDRVRQLQADVARRVYEDRRNLVEKRYPAVYTAGDLVLLWEPQYWARKTRRSEKLSYRWTGPWEVLRGNDAAVGAGADADNEVDVLEAGDNGDEAAGEQYNTVKIYHGRRDVELVTNVNRLRRFDSWDDAGPSICLARPLGRKPADFSDPALFVVGALCVIRLEPVGGSAPWCIAKLLEIHDDDSVIVQWYGNAFGDLMRMHLPGWRDPKDRKVYYSRGRHHGSHTVYTNQHDNVRLELAHCYAAGFSLTSAHRVPHAVLEYLTNVPDIRWSLEEYRVPRFDA